MRPANQSDAKAAFSFFHVETSAEEEQLRVCTVDSGGAEVLTVSERHSLNSLDGFGQGTEE